MSYLTQMMAASNPVSWDQELRRAGFVGGLSVSGVTVSAETALNLSTAWACDRLLSETIASLPALVFERLADGGRQRAVNHPLYDVLHQAPNEYQTPVEFFDFMTHCAVMRGNGYAQIIAGPRGFADQLRPIHPDYVWPETLPSGRLRYRVTEPDRPAMVLTDAEMLHLRGMSADGKLGQSVISYARDALGIALAAEQHGGRFFRNNAEPRGLLKSAKTLSPEAAKRLKESWEASHSGANQHRVAVLEDGLDYQAVSFNNKDAQLLESREFQAEDVCRWFRVPPHMVGLTSKATSWGSGIEQLSIGFVTYTLTPWLVRWQQAITRDLILAPRKYFVEFLVDALLRGDLKARYDAYAVARQWGWFSVNDIRRKENENPVAGGDEYLVPMNMQPAGTSRAGGAGLARAAAGRVLRREVSALERARKRAGDDATAWQAAVEDFYHAHAEFVGEALGLSQSQAAAYAERQERLLLAEGPTALDDWEARHAGLLAALVLEAE